MTEADGPGLPLRLDASGCRVAFFDHSGLDQMLSMLLELSAELWVVRERIYALEAVADDQGLKFREAIESWRPSRAQAEELASLRDRMTREIFRTLSREHRPARTLDTKGEGA